MTIMAVYYFMPTVMDQSCFIQFPSHFEQNNPSLLKICLQWLIDEVSVQLAAGRMIYVQLAAGKTIAVQLATGRTIAVQLASSRMIAVQIASGRIIYV